MVHMMNKQREMNIKLAKMILENPKLNIVYAIHGEDDDIQDAIGEDMFKELEIDDVFIGDVAHMEYVNKYGEKTERVCLLDNNYSETDFNDYFEYVINIEGYDDSDKIEGIMRHCAEKSIIVCLRGV